MPRAPGARKRGAPAQPDRGTVPRASELGGGGKSGRTHARFLPRAHRRRGDRINREAGSGAETPSCVDDESALRVENPLLRSGLALAGANRRGAGDGEDGILTALEAANLDLWGTELVVLSACDSGVGEVRNGEGVYGLRRALVLAGSETQVMSLWHVDDRATRDLMVKYYGYLRRGAGRAEALRRAQLAMVRNPRQAHPAYWAAFIVSGDWRPLRTQRHGEQERPVRDESGTHAPGLGRARTS